MLKTPPLIIINDNLVDQIRFPKSKKSRIRKKWKNEVQILDHHIPSFVSMVNLFAIQ